MSINIPKTLRPYIDDEISSGNFASESELVTASLELVRELSERHARLRSDVANSIAESDSGLSTPLDMSSIKSNLIAKFDSNCQLK